MGGLPSEYRKMTFRDIFRCIQGHYQRLEVEADTERIKLQNQWIIARRVLFHMIELSPNIKRHHKPASPKEWMPFEWEKKIPEHRNTIITDYDADELRAQKEKAMRRLGIAKAN